MSGLGKKVEAAEAGYFLAVKYSKKPELMLV
jgi:hypothetical protein